MATVQITLLAPTIGLNIDNGFFLTNTWGNAYAGVLSRTQNGTYAASGFLAREGGFDTIAVNGWTTAIRAEVDCVCSESVASGLSLQIVVATAGWVNYQGLSQLMTGSFSGTKTFTLTTNPPSGQDFVGSDIHLLDAATLQAQWAVSGVGFGTTIAITVTAIRLYIDYTPLTDPSAPPLRLFDGVTDYPFAMIPFNQEIQIAGAGAATYASNVGQIIKFQGAFYCISFDDYTTVRGTVWRINPRSGNLSKLGNGFAKTGSNLGTESNHGAPWRLIAWDNKLWVVTNQLASATCAVFRIRPDADTVWSEDKEIAGSYGTGLATAFGKLYVTFMYASGTTPKAIYERDEAGTWTARATMTSAGYAGFFKPVAFDSKVFAFKQDEAADSVTSIIATTDGVTWTEDLSDSALNTLVGQELNDAKIGAVLIFKSNLYVVVIGEEPGSAGKILKRVPGAIAASGVWTLQTTAAAGFSGYAAVLTTPA